MWSCGEWENENVCLNEYITFQTCACVCVYRYRYVNKFMLVERITIIMLQIQDVMANRLPKRMASWLFFSIFFFFFLLSSSVRKIFRVRVRYIIIFSSFYLLFSFSDVVTECRLIPFLCFSYHITFDSVHWTEPCWIYNTYMCV